MLEKKYPLIERGMNATMKDHGLESPLDSSKVMRHTYENVDHEK